MNSQSTEPDKTPCTWSQGHELSMSYCQQYEPQRHIGAVPSDVNAIAGCSLPDRAVQGIPTTSIGLASAVFVPAFVVAIVSMQSAFVAFVSGSMLFLPNYSYTHGHPILVAIGLACLVGTVLAAIMTCKTATWARSASRSTLGALAGAGLLEYSALHWPSDSAPDASTVFIQVNMVACACALLLAAPKTISLLQAFTSAVSGPQSLPARPVARPAGQLHQPESR
jgi:hypothetical protein